MRKDDPELFYTTGSKALKEFIGDKLNITGSALTSEELERILSSRGISGDVVAKIKEVIAFFETGQFGIKKYTSEERQSVYNSMIKLIKTLNKELKK